MRRRPPATCSSLCSAGALLFAASGNGLFVSDDDATTWRQVDPSYMSPLSCGQGLVVGGSGSTLSVSDGGAVQRTTLPGVLNSAVFYVDPATGRVWLSSNSGAAFLR